MKTIKIVQLIVWLLIIACLMTVLVLFVLGRMNFSSFIKTDKQIELLQQTEKMDGITKINFDLCSADIIIKPSDSDEISINYRGPESIKDKIDLTAAVDNGVLTIRQDRSRQFFFFGFWNLTPRVLEVKIPADYANEINVGNTSGNLTITGDYSLTAFTARLTSGDANLDTIKCPGFSLESTSGDVNLGVIEAQNLNISLTSGQITAASLTGNGYIGTMSGDIRIDSLKGTEKISATSGDVTLSSLSGGGSVTCTSGDIEVNVAESLGSLSVRTSSGSVDMSFEDAAAYKIDAHCTSGDVSADFPLTYSNGNNSASGEIGSNASDKLEVQTTSGDIKFAS